MTLKGSKAKKLYEIAEKIRFETIGTEEYIGIRENLFNFYSKQKPPQNKQENIYFAFENYLRREFFKLNGEFKKKYFKLNLKKILIKSLKSKLIKLKKILINKIYLMLLFLKC